MLCLLAEGKLALPKSWQSWSYQVLEAVAAVCSINIQQKINKQTILPSYSGTSIQGTPSGPRQVFHEGMLGCSLLIINQQIKSIPFVLPRNLLQPLFQSSQIMYKKSRFTYLCNIVCWTATSAVCEIAHVVKAVIIVTGALLNLSTLFVVSHFFEC